jgi:hypothetical protein
MKRAYSSNKCTYSTPTQPASKFIPVIKKFLPLKTKNNCAFTLFLFLTFVLPSVREQISRIIHMQSEIDVPENAIGQPCGCGSGSCYAGKRIQLRKRQHLGMETGAFESPIHVGPIKVLRRCPKFAWRASIAAKREWLSGASGATAIAVGFADLGTRFERNVLGMGGARKQKAENNGNLFAKCSSNFRKHDCTTCSVSSGPECSILQSHVTPWSHTSLPRTLPFESQCAISLHLIFPSLNFPPSDRTVAVLDTFGKNCRSRVSQCSGEFLW